MSATSPAWAGDDPQIAQITLIGKSPYVNQDPQTYAIIGAAMEVHRPLGAGFLEAVYQQAMAIELTERIVLNLRESAQSSDRFLLKDQSLN